MTDIRRQESIERAVQTEYEIWNYPLDASPIVEETLYVTNWTTPDTNILWHYYETVKNYI